MITNAICRFSTTAHANCLFSDSMIACTITERKTDSICQHGKKTGNMCYHDKKTDNMCYQGKKTDSICYYGKKDR